MVDEEGLVSTVPNLLLLFHPPTDAELEDPGPPSWLCFAKSRLDFPGVRGDGNEGFEVQNQGYRS